MNYALYIVTCSLIIFDIITGMLKAVKNHNLDSTILRQGLYHKLAEILAMICPGLLYYGAQYADINIPFPLPEAVCGYIAIMEVLSAIENICEVNPQLFGFFQPYLKKLKQKGESVENGKGY